MNSEISLMFMRSFGLHLNALNLTPYSNLPSRNRPWWKLHFWPAWGHMLDLTKDHQWMTSILRLFADIVGRMCSKTLMMVIQKALYHHLVLLMMQCCHCQWHAIITGWNPLWCLVQKMVMQQNSSGIGCFILCKEKNDLILITFDFALLTNPN